MAKPENYQEETNPTSLDMLFPRSVLSVSRQEFGVSENQPALNLKIKCGTLPADICGHVYIVAPVGSIDSDSRETDNNVVLPYKSGTIMLYNGDGMIYHFDFSTKGVVSLSSAIVKTPCHYADLGTHQENYQDLKFYDFGITRISRELGLCDQPNTAFIPVKFSNDEHPRLFVTWDVGRPYEIDSKTLRVITPVGRLSEWKRVNPIDTLPFAAIQTSAHPCFDPRAGGGEFFSTNVGRSPRNIFLNIFPVYYIILQLIRGKYSFKLIQDAFGELGEVIRQWFLEKIVPKENANLLNNILDWFDDIRNSIGILFKLIFEYFRGNFVRVVRWDGSGKLHSWEVRYNNRPITITESTHQIGLTKDYVIILDCAFKLGIDEIWPTKRSRFFGGLIEWLEGRMRNIDWKEIRDILDRPQLPDNHVYIVRRADLDPEKETVPAQKVIIPYEAAHFLVDYQNPDGNIKIHFAHVCAWDAAECVSKYDYVQGDSIPIQEDPELTMTWGAFYNPTDISRLGYAVVNGETGELAEQRISIMDTKLTWAPALYAYPYGENYATSPDEFKDIFWLCAGVWKDLPMKHMLDLYSDYKYRQVGLDLIEQILKQEGRPSALVRLHINSQSNGDRPLEIIDSYQFPLGYLPITPQFVPAEDTNEIDAGYLICVVHYDKVRDGEDHNLPTNGNEIWVFKAGKLRQGPVCQLYHPQMNIGFTVHSAWLKTAQSPTNSQYNVDIREDYDPIIEQQPRSVKTKIQKLFENFVYPEWESRS